jgi:hypothetical protein
MDSSLLTTCRYTGITKTGSNVAEFRLCANCGGYTHKTVGIASRTKFDLTVNNAVVDDPAFVAQPVKDLLGQEGFMCSHCGYVLTDFSVLSSEITTAQTLHDGATEGTDPGEYAVGSKATFQTAIDAAQAVVTAETATEAQKNTAIATLRTAVATFESGIVA